MLCMGTWKLTAEKQLEINYTYGARIQFCVQSSFFPSISEDLEAIKDDIADIVQDFDQRLDRIKDSEATVNCFDGELG